MPDRADVVVFDLDDTLYHEHDYVRSGFRAVGAHVQRQCGIDGFFDVIWGLFQQGVRNSTFDRALAQFGHTPDPALIRELVRVYREHTPQIGLCPDADAVLRELKDRHVPTGLITDGPLASQRAKVAALSLRERIDCPILTAELGPDAGKPSPKPFGAIMEHFGVTDPSRYVYLGDNPAKDFIGARSLGWQTIRIRRSHGERVSWEPAPGHEADLEWPDLTPLIEWLRLQD